MAETLLSIGGGFLLAVLWFDLMFDVQALRAPGSAALPEPVLASIAAYYRRVTRDANPMGRAVGLAMLATLAASIAELATGAPPLAPRLLSAALVAAASAFAAGRVLPNALRLAARRDSLDVQSRLARSIARDHLACLAAIASFLALQLAS
jgi:hypothetical protein